MLTSVFGISIKYEAWNHQDSLPVYIAGSYDFQTAYIGNRRCIMLAPIEELATLPALTTIHVPKQYMGEAAAQKLIDLLNTPGQPPTKTEVSTMLVKRGTV